MFWNLVVFWGLSWKLFHETKEDKIQYLLESWEIVTILNIQLLMPWTGSLGSMLIGELGELKTH